MSIFSARNFIKSVCSLTLLVVLIQKESLFSQSLENIKDQKLITLGGFVSTNQVINQQPNDSNNVFTYNSYYTGSLNLNIYGINAPFLVSHSMSI